MFRLLIKHDCCKQSKRIVLCKKLDHDIILFKYKSHYTSLGLSSDASPKEIKSAYYNLSLKFHPDKNNGSKDSVEKFREITEAYEVLGNTEKKKQYDQDLNSKYSDSSWRRQTYSPRSDEFRTSYAQRTGRTKYYNYDEHYRQHYEEYKRYQREDYEYFKQRWEANFRRRYPHTDGSEWIKYNKRPPTPPKMPQVLFYHKSFIYFMTVWIFMFLIGFPFYDMNGPEKNKSNILYYQVHEKDKKTTEDEVNPTEK